MREITRRPTTQIGSGDAWGDSDAPMLRRLRPAYMGARREVSSSATRTIPDLRTLKGNKIGLDEWACHWKPLDTHRPAARDTPAQAFRRPPAATQGPQETYE
jgi:hypothetical protein